MMKFCPYCGTEMLSEEAAFCMGCGNKLPHGMVRRQKNGNEKKKRTRGEEKTIRSEKTGNLRRNNADNSFDRKRVIDNEEMHKHYEYDDIMEMYAEEHETDTRYDETGFKDYEETKQYNPPVRKKKRHVDDYDGYYDDVVPYDKGRVREDNILEMVKKVFVIIIAALLIVAVCVVMMYIL